MQLVEQCNLEFIGIIVGSFGSNRQWICWLWGHSSAQHSLLVSSGVGGLMYAIGGGVAGSHGEKKINESLKNFICSYHFIHQECL